MEEIQILLDQLLVIEQRITAVKNDALETNADEKIARFSEQRCKLLDRMVAQANEATDYDYLGEISIPNANLILSMGEEITKLNIIISELHLKSVVVRNGEIYEQKAVTIQNVVSRLRKDALLVKLLHCPMEEFISVIRRDYGMNIIYRNISINDRIMLIEKTDLNSALNDFYDVKSIISYLGSNGIKVPRKYKDTKIAVMPNSYDLRNKILIDDCDKQRVEFNDLYHELLGSFYSYKMTADFCDVSNSVPVIFQDDKDDLYYKISEYVKLITDLELAESVEQCVNSADNNLELKDLEKTYNELITKSLTSDEHEKIVDRIATISANKSFFGSKKRREELNILNQRLDLNKLNCAVARKTRKDILLKYYMIISEQLDNHNINSEMFFGYKTYEELQKSLRTENYNCLVNMALDDKCMMIESEKAGLSYPFRGLVSAAKVKLSGYYLANHIDEAREIDLNKCNKYMEIYNDAISKDSIKLYTNYDRVDYCVDKSLSNISEEYIKSNKYVDAITKRKTFA